MKKNNGKWKAGKTTKTGEIIPSTFNWIDPDIQRRRAEKLAKNTERK